MPTSIDIVSTQINDYNYCYLTLIIQFNINHLFVNSEVVTSIAIWHKLFYLTRLIYLHTFKWVQVLLWNANNSIKHQLFVYIQLNGQTVLFLTFRFNVSN